MSKVKANTKDALRVLCVDVCTNANKLTKIHAQIDYFTEHGEELKPKKQFYKHNILDMNLAELFAVTTSVPSKITRERRRADKLEEGPAKLQKLKDIDLMQEQLDEVKKLFRDENARIVID